MGWASYLGGDDEGFSVDGFVLHPFANPFLGDACEFLGGWDGVDLGGVEEVDTSFDGCIHDLVAFFFIGLGAKGHGAEAYTADDHSTFA